MGLATWPLARANGCAARIVATLSLLSSLAQAQAAPLPRLHRYHGCTSTTAPLPLHLYHGCFSLFLHASLSHCRSSPFCPPGSEQSEKREGTRKAHGRQPSGEGQGRRRMAKGNGEDLGEGQGGGLPVEHRWCVSSVLLRGKA